MTLHYLFLNDLITHVLQVLHMDRNDYYGGDSASVNLQQLFEKFKAPVNEALGSSRDFNIDLAPKFIMANGKLVKMLIMTNVNRYLEFKQVSYHLYLYLYLYMCVCVRERD